MQSITCYIKEHSVSTFFFFFFFFFFGGGGGGGQCSVLLQSSFTISGYWYLYFAASIDVSVFCTNRLCINSVIILKLLEPSGV